MNDRVYKVHEEALVVDTHCDTLKCMLPQFTMPRNSMWEDRSKTGLGVKTNIGHIDIPRLVEGGVNCQVFAISSERDTTPAYPLRTALEMIEIFYSECESHSNIIKSAVCHEDIVRANNEGKVAAILSIEGADVLEGRLRTLSVYHRLGVRIVGLVHSLRNLLADGVSERRSKGGLSQFGIEVVEELNKLGMVVDVSHLSDPGFWDVIEVSKDPPLASHSNARSICDHPRNLSDEMIRAMSEKGGVVGINFAPDFVHKNDPSVKTLVDHIDRIVELVGPEHIGLGSDFDGIPSTPIGLEDVTKLPSITKELLKRGYSEHDIKLILGENHLRLFKKVMG